MAKIADIDEVMYNCGLETLHPGGIEKTDELARLCRIGADKSLLDIGAGRGASACYLAGKYGCRVAGIDISERMIAACQDKAARQGLADRVRFTVADACNLPFDDDEFDIVIAECVTSLLDKRSALGEMIRVTKPGGYVGDLEMTWQERPPQAAVEETYEIWGGYRTMTPEQWKALLEELGLHDVEVVDFTDAIPSMEATMKRELGLKGRAKMAWQLLLHGDLRRAMQASRRIFRDYADYMGYGCFVGRKPQRK